MRDTSRAGLEATIREYFDGCNQASAAKMMACMEPEATHYFPTGAPQGTFKGAAAIAQGWIKAVQTLGSIWSVDHVLADSNRLEAVIEWTHFKPKTGTYLRGDEWYVFSKQGLITEIRAYYACPAADPPRSHEIGDFDYAGRGYPLRPLPIKR